MQTTELLRIDGPKIRIVRLGESLAVYINGAVVDGVTSASVERYPDSASKVTLEIEPSEIEFE